MWNNEMRRYFLLSNQLDPRNERFSVYSMTASLVFDAIYLIALHFGTAVRFTRLRFQLAVICCQC